MNIIYKGKDYGIDPQELLRAAEVTLEPGEDRDVTVETVESLAEMRAVLHRNVPAWIKAAADGNRIYVLDPEKWDDPDVPEDQIVRHELVHVIVSLKGIDCPSWLNEGIAMLVSGQLDGKETPSGCPYDPYKKFHRKYDYENIAAVMRRLVCLYGKQDIIRHFFSVHGKYEKDCRFGKDAVAKLCADFRRERGPGLVCGLVDKYKMRLAVGCIFTAGYLVTIFLIPLVSEYLIDDVLKTSSMTALRNGIAIFFAICVLQPLFGYVKDMIFLRISEDIVFELRERMFEKMLRFEYSVFESRRKGEFLSRITNDIRGVSSLVTDVIISLVKNAALIVLLIIGMLMQSALITLIILGCFALYYLYNYHVSRKLEQISKDSLENYDDLCSSINQSLDNILILKTNNFLRHASEKFDRIVTRTKALNLLIGKWGTLLGTVSGVIVIASLSIIYSVGAVQVMRNRMTLGMVIALGLYFQQLSSPIQEIMSAVVQYRETRPSIRRMEQFLNVPDEEDAFRETGKVVGGGEAGTIRFEHVTFRYEDALNGSTVLNDASFTFRRGVNVIYGASGEGKSTILKLISGLYNVNEGKIVFGIPASSLSELRRGIAYVSQDVLLLNDTVCHNLTLGIDTTREEVERVCRAVGIDDKIREMPDGYDSVISERINLSGGEKQRLAIARALLRKTDVLLLDEVTSGLDRNRKQKVYESIRSAADDAVVVLVSHDPDALKYADRTFRIQDGKLLDTGSEPADARAADMRAAGRKKENRRTEPDLAPISGRADREEPLCEAG